jgi:hypothetical protein
MCLLSRIVLSFFLIAILAMADRPASAQSGVVLVVADHRDPSSIPSSSDIFKAAYDTIAAQLKRRGMIVRGVGDIPSVRKMSGKIERNLGLAVEVARSSSARISTVLGVKIFISMNRGKRANGFYVWIDGEARDVTFGKVTATHEHRSRERHKVEKSCGRDCMLETAAEVVAPTAAEFAKAMAEKLQKARKR